MEMYIFMHVLIPEAWIVGLAFSWTPLFSVYPLSECYIPWKTGAGSWIGNGLFPPSSLEEGKEEDATRMPFHFGKIVACKCKCCFFVCLFVFIPYETLHREGFKNSITQTCLQRLEVRQAHTDVEGCEQQRLTRPQEKTIRAGGHSWCCAERDQPTNGLKSEEWDGKLPSGEDGWKGCPSPSRGQGDRGVW